MESEGDAEFHAAVDIVLAFDRVDLVAGIEGEVSGDVWGEDSALGELDASGEGDPDVVPAVVDAGDFGVGVVVDAVTDGGGRDEGEPAVDFDWVVEGGFEVLAGDFEVVPVTDGGVEAEEGFGDGEAEVLSAGDGGVRGVGEAEGGAVDGTGEGVEEAVVGVGEAEFGEASVVGEACEEVEFGVFEGTWDVGVDGGGVEDAGGEGEFIGEWDTEGGAGPDVVAGEPETAEVVFGVVAGLEGDANGVEETDGFCWWRDWNWGFRRGGGGGACDGGRGEHQGTGGAGCEGTEREFGHWWFGCGLGSGETGRWFAARRNGRVAMGETFPVPRASWEA